ncbi:MAG TPA: MarR family transcriptional regulator [Sporolactobacillaceae bacterium]|nr:MarR family transcriptional regulator [Sporolactobacillaceae bacterium]
MDERRALTQKVEQSFRLIFRRVQRDLNELFKGNGITSHEFIFLKRLSLEEPIKISDLSKDMNVTASYATAVSERLLKQGFLNRNRSTIDRRIVELTSTPSGRMLVERLERRKAVYLQKLFSHVSMEDMETLDVLLEKIQKGMD